MACSRTKNTPSTQKRRQKSQTSPGLSPPFLVRLPNRVTCTCISGMRLVGFHHTYIKECDREIEIPLDKVKKLCSLNNCMCCPPTSAHRQNPGGYLISLPGTRTQHSPWTSSRTRTYQTRVFPLHQQGTCRQTPLRLF